MKKDSERIQLVSQGYFIYICIVIINTVDGKFN